MFTVWLVSLHMDNASCNSTLHSVAGLQGFTVLYLGIALGLVLPPDPTHPLLQFEVKFSHHLNAVDAGYAVMLYLWLLVSD